jgi:hypothetical protein
MQGEEVRERTLESQHRDHCWVVYGRCGGLISLIGNVTHGLTARGASFFDVGAKHLSRLVYSTLDWCQKGHYKLDKTRSYKLLFRHEHSSWSYSLIRHPLLSRVRPLLHATISPC